MPASMHKKNEDNFYRRAQLEAMIREEFGNLKVFESDDGEEFFIPNPQAYSDDLVEKLRPLNDQRDVAAALLEEVHGEGVWDKFKTAGGQSMFVTFAVKREQDRVNGTLPGDGSPTD